MTEHQEKPCDAASLPNGRGVSSDETNAGTAPRTPYLTIVIVNDAEKAPRLMHYCLQSLWLLNSEVLGTAQVLILNQDRDAASISGFLVEAERAGVEVELVDANCEYVGDHCLWDMMASLCDCRARMKGRYLLVMHKEFVPGPGSLYNSVAWLRKSGEPCLALGNLLRLGERTDISWRQSSDRDTSDVLRKVMDTCSRVEIEKLLASIPASPWTKQGAPVTTGKNWREDLFFARLDWLDCLRFFEHADRLLFQDIYDLLGVVWRSLKRADLAPPVERMPREVNSVYHLWHTKKYPHFSDGVISWFASDPERWTGTRFGDPRELKAMRDLVARPKTGSSRLYRFRTGPGGTVARYAAAFRRWLNGEGKSRLTDFYHRTEPTDSR